MVVGIRQVLAEAGVPADRVHTELFFVEDVPPEQARHDEPAADGPTSAVTVVLDGRSTELALPRDVPVLDAAQRHRPDLPFACKGGVCGTCRAKVTAGEVRMRRNFALERVRGGRRLRADLPVAAGHRRGHRRLRRLSRRPARRRREGCPGRAVGR